MQKFEKTQRNRATVWAHSSIERPTMKFLSISSVGVLQRRTAVAFSNYILTCGWRSLSSSAAPKRVGTHDGKFHCDEALGCFMIRRTAKFHEADIIRSRDPLVWWKSARFVCFWLWRRVICWKLCCIACNMCRFWMSSTPCWMLEEFMIRAEIDTITIRKVLRRFLVADLWLSSAVLALSIRCWL